MKKQGHKTRMVKKRLFPHGGSYAVDLPVEFVRQIDDKQVQIEVIAGGDGGTEVRIFNNSELDTIEHEPEFALFVKALVQDALTHPESLRDVNETWGEKWDSLLEGVEIDDEE